MRTYEIEHIRTGKRRDLLCNQIDLRHLVPDGWRVAEVPSRISVCPTGGPSQGESVIRGFYAEEQKCGSHSDLIKGMGLRDIGLKSASDVKKCWNVK